MSYVEGLAQRENKASEGGGGDLLPPDCFFVFPGDGDGVVVFVLYTHCVCMAVRRCLPPGNCCLASVCRADPPLTPPPCSDLPT